MIDLNSLLELSNGVWTILGLVLLFAVIEYLYLEHHMRGLGIERWFGDLPVSMQLGAGIATLVLGFTIRSASVWFWRMLEAQTPLDYPTVVIGTVIAGLGMIWLIRVISRPRYGYRLVAIGIGCAGLFIVGTLILH